MVGVVRVGFIRGEHSIFYQYIWRGEIGNEETRRITVLNRYNFRRNRDEAKP
jgi:hypothetical protein